MTRLGHELVSEEHGPADLFRNAAASEYISVDAVGKAVSCGPSVEHHLEAIESSSLSVAIT